MSKADAPVIIPDNRDIRVAGVDSREGCGMLHRVIQGHQGQKRIQNVRNAYAVHADAALRGSELGIIGIAKQKLVAMAHFHQNLDQFRGQEYPSAG